MFRQLLSRNLRRFVSTETKYAASKQFQTGSRSQGGRSWVPIGIFGSSFLIGWYLTKHMTFTDVMAYWRYDKLPRDSPEVKKYQIELKDRLNKLPILNQLSQNGYVEVVNNDNNNTSKKENTQDRLVLQGLSSPGAIGIEPKFYYNPRTKDTVGIYHLGMKLTGYPFIIHGGVLATVLEDLMRESVKFVMDKPGEKLKDLTISYRSPTLANQFVVVRTSKIEQSGKQIKLIAQVMDSHGRRVLVEGKGSFKV